MTTENDGIHEGHSPFAGELSYTIDEQGTSWVVLKILAMTPVGPAIAAYLQYRPDEARSLGGSLLEAAETAESRAVATLALREQKIPEETIQAVLLRMEDRRGR